MTNMERVQRHTTRIVARIRGISCEGRLQALELFPVSYTRPVGDLICLWKILRDDLEPELRAVSTTKLQPNPRPRAHSAEAGVDGSSFGLPSFSKGDYCGIHSRQKKPRCRMMSDSINASMSTWGDGGNLQTAERVVIGTVDEEAHTGRGPLPFVHEDQVNVHRTDNQASRFLLQCAHKVCTHHCELP
ncbi:unnamed protein product [Echinostoma caproni]|uniref:Uncharacterized protein n=1 Tax=Echinostoma caproni TaxID=27848 RepID=A0A183BB73_9TREM|nr:unnamed protein product [Echinostoma caproni]